MSYQSVVNVLNKMVKTPCRIIMLTLASEGVDNLLLDTLLALGQTLVLRTCTD